MKREIIYKTQDFSAGLFLGLAITLLYNSFWVYIGINIDALSMYIAGLIVFVAGILLVLIR